MKTLGMIGGTSWYSTIEYYRYINSMVNEQKGKLINPPIILKSINMEVMATGNWDLIAKKFVESGLLLEHSGVEGLIMCANTPHKVFPLVEEAVKIPMIHIGDATAEYAKKNGIKCLALLGTENVMGEEFISARMEEKYGLEVIVPDVAQQPSIHKVIVEELVMGVFKPETQAFILQQMNRLKARGADGVALACTEFPILMKGVDYDLPLLNTTYLHAKKAVAFILG